MAKFNVCAEMSVTLEIEIETESYEEAREIAKNKDGAEFTEVEGSGDWSISNITQLEEVEHNE